jgi:diaminohydroxyphosphoribosylaminopyrimidine deaminase/5-amino-6-(5-phosphoribosylamino)uracil reductase
MHLPHLHTAQALATQALTLSNPNPRVGCVLTDASGRVVGQGHTQAVGGPHAEVMALRDAQAQGHDVRGGTAYVTMEPCSHHGRTPPCCDALVAAGLAEVVIATLDPNPLVAGQGAERLRAAGLRVHVMPAHSAESMAARELNIGFFSRMVRGRPWVRLKMAASLDGISALPNGVSQWITGEAARADGHAWRARACAVLTGVGTVRTDNPTLDVRAVTTTRQPQLFVVDSRFETPPSAALLQPVSSGQARAVHIVGTEGQAQAQPQRLAALQAAGAHTLALKADSTQAKVDLAELMAHLGRSGVNELHVEAGHGLNASLFRGGWIDECLIYLAPQLLGQGAGMASLGPLNALSDGVALSFDTVERVGVDLRVIARVGEHHNFLHFD